MSNKSRIEIASSVTKPEQKDTLTTPSVRDTKVTSTPQQDEVFEAKGSGFKPFVIDPQRHVKMWFSKDGIPLKHQARFLKFKQNNPDATLTIIYADKYLTPEGRQNIQEFAKKAGITLVDYGTIKPRDAEEEAMKQWIDHELEYYFSNTDPAKKGNLSVVSDQLRLFEQVLELGIVSDCDVEFEKPLTKNPITAELGVIAKTRLGVDGHSGGVRISNDMIGGDPKHPVFKMAKKLVCEHNAKYRAGLPAYFAKHGIEFDPLNYKNHPLYYQARNEQLSKFSLGGGPQIFAIAMHKNGIATGYETAEQPEVFVANENFTFTPYDFGDKDKEQIKRDFSRLLPQELGASLVAHWDHSWEAGAEKWKQLNPGEEKLLRRFTQDNEQSSDAKDQKMVSFVPRRGVSHLQAYLSSFVDKDLPGRRHREFDELTQAEQQYILENELPDEKVRTELVKMLGKDFENIAATFSKDGVLILPGYFSGDKLKALQAVFNKEIAKKTPHPFLKQSAFNASVDTDSVEESSVQTVFEASTDPNLQALIRYHFGQQQTLAAMRGYRQYKTKPVLYRAWDYHQDLKTKGPYGEIKIMVLINGVMIEGQAMRVMKGAHKYHWYTKSQQHTKYTIEEGLEHADDGRMAICYGAPGTVILFDTNIIHSGTRNDHSERDIFTISYAPDSKQAPIMSKRFAQRKATTTDMKYEADDDFWRQLAVNNESLSPAQVEQLRAEYHRIPTIEQLKDRFTADGSVKFHDFLVSALSTDVNGDLDLILRMGKEDTIRDNHLIAIRDVPPEHEQYKRAARRVKQKENDTIIRYDFDLDQVRKYAVLAGKYKNSKITELSHCAIFALDLEEALSRNDGIQRLRTTLAYLYLNLDRMEYLMEKHGIIDENTAAIRHAADAVLNHYMSIVYINDLQHSMYAGETDDIDEEPEELESKRSTPSSSTSSSEPSPSVGPATATSSTASSAATIGFFPVKQDSKKDSGSVDVAPKTHEVDSDSTQQPSTTPLHKSSSSKSK